MISVYFKNLLGLTASLKSIVKYLPNRVERWGKMWFKGDAECIRSRWAHKVVKEIYRDASFARLDLVIDKYEANPGRPARDKQIMCYGQVQSFIYVTLPAKQHLKTDCDSTAILALVTLCKTDGKDASLTLVWYQEMEIVQAFNIAKVGSMQNSHPLTATETNPSKSLRCPCLNPNYFCRNVNRHHQSNSLNLICCPQPWCIEF